MSGWRTLVLGYLILGVNPLSISAEPVQPEKELLILHTSVVEDSRAKNDGPWSFTTLLKNLSPLTSDPADFVAEWLNEWATVHTLNSFSIAPRPLGELFRIWPKTKDGKIDLSKPPFHLLAIVYRNDLANPETPQGEGRMVFGAFDPMNGEPLEFTMIFEYALPATLDWNKAFHALGKLEFGEKYNQALETITRNFTDRLANGAPAPLAQVRTNDFFLDFHWELREFRLNKAGKLAQVPVAQTPAEVFQRDRASELIAWLDSHKDEVVAEKFKLPDFFLAPSAFVPSESFVWLPQVDVSDPVRRAFGRNTCNGCHAGETESRFTHVFPRRRGNPSLISDFLTEELKKRSFLLESKFP